MRVSIASLTMIFIFISPSGCISEGYHLLAVGRRLFGCWFDLLMMFVLWICGICQYPCSWRVQVAAISTFHISVLVFRTLFCWMRLRASNVLWNWSASWFLKYWNPKHFVRFCPCLLRLYLDLYVTNFVMSWIFILDAVFGSWTSTIGRYIFFLFFFRYIPAEEEIRNHVLPILFGFLRSS